MFELLMRVEGACVVCRSSGCSMGDHHFTLGWWLCKGKEGEQGGSMPLFSTFDQARSFEFRQQIFECRGLCNRASGWHLHRQSSCAFGEMLFLLHLLRVWPGQFLTSNQRWPYRTIRSWSSGASRSGGEDFGCFAHHGWFWIDAENSEFQHTNWQEEGCIVSQTTMNPVEWSTVVSMRWHLRLSASSGNAVWWSGWPHTSSLF